MARTLAGADYIIGGIGGLVGIGSTGHTLLTICRRAANGAWHTPLSIETSAGSSRLALQFSNTNTIQLIIGSANKDTTVGITSSDGWVLAAVTRAAGTTTPRGHKYVYGTDTWTHADAAATTGGDSTDLTGGRWQAGRWQTTDFYNGDQLLDAAWKRALTDAELEQLPLTLLALARAEPDALLLFDQHATSQAVIDLTSGGAHQTSVVNTSVATSSVPVWSYGQGASVTVGQSGGAASHTADATLTATATVTTTAAGNKPLTAALTATAAVTTTAASTKPATAALTATVTASTAAATTKPIDATRTTTATITAGAATTKPVDAALTVTANLAAAATVGAAPVTVNATAAFTATITPAAASLKPAAAALTGTAAISTTAAATRPVQAALTATASITADATIAGAYTPALVGVDGSASSTGATDGPTGSSGHDSTLTAVGSGDGATTATGYL